MRQLSRRALLTSAAAATATATLAGCLGGGDDAPESVRLTEVYLKNESETAHTLHLELSRDDERQFEESIPVRGRTDEQIYNANVAPPDFESVAGHWVIRARLDDESTAHELTSDQLTAKDGCVRALVSVERDDSVAYASGIGPDQCTADDSWRDDD
ncbi:hypothetical protein [Haloarchaeobius sp. DFWS5]|uniref:hypothetical protein n=1 Tax=Haloarchaeobius sp. DFWS5 TaxID=3446114 RepID=UPI003EB6AC44